MNSRRNPRASRNAVPAPKAPPRDAFAAARVRLAAQRPVRHATLRKVVAAIGAGLLPLARFELNDHLAHHPEDADALHLLAQVAVRQERRDEAIAFLERCVASAPDFDEARLGLATLLLQANRSDDALREAGRLLERDADNPLFLQMKAAILSAVGDAVEALPLWERLTAQSPRHAESWVQCGDARRAAGHRDDSVAAYRRAIECRPSCGSGWWSLANLKTYRFDEADVAAMRAQLRATHLSLDDRVALQFALAKALEDRAAYPESFALYADGNAAMRPRVDYDSSTLTAGVARNKVLFTAEFFRDRAQAGCPVPDPIFILGRPRSGSTLVEQILASHPAIEGAGELPYVSALAAGYRRGDGPVYGIDYLDALAATPPSELAALGEAYLARARAHLRLGRPRFVDKNPGNFAHLALIQLMLPNAKIVDVRRHPGGCCWSMFTTYSSKARLTLPELGLFYRDYLELMAHFDAVLPGRVHHVMYEDLVGAPETEIRRLLDYLGLPFEPACLRFHETKRAVMTPSSEQVRRPLTGDAVSHWRNYEPWLGPLFESLGPARDAYR
jgi:cytochrome c-type biogenesis protein CcmH/NrfG